MAADYEIALAAPDDVPAIVALQEPNVPDNGGTLSVRQTADWFRRSLLEMPIVVGRRNSIVVGYLVSSSLAAQAHVGIVQALLRHYAAPPDCYLYGPVCIAEMERGNGLAGTLYEHLRAHLPGRPAMTFVRADNAPSLRAHRKMGMRELGFFTNEATQYVAFAYD